MFTAFAPDRAGDELFVGSMLATARRRAWRFGALLAVLLSVLLAAMPRAYADGDLIVSRAALEDRTGAMTIDEAASAGTGFESIGAVLARGYSSSSWWLRLDVAPSPDGDPVLLRFRQPFLDQVTLFERQADGRWTSRTTGDRYSHADRDYRSLKLGFLVRPDPPQSTYFVRVNTSSTVLVDVEGVSLSDAPARDARESSLNAAALAILACLIAMGIVEYRVTRQRLGALFVLFQLAALAVTLGGMGYYALLAPRAFPQAADLALTLALVAYPCITAILHSAFLREYAPAPFPLRLLGAARWYLPVALVAIAAGHAGPALHGNAILVAGLAPLSLVTALSTTRDGVPSRRAVIVVFSMLALLFLVAVFSPLALLPNSQWNQYLAVPVSLAAGVLLFFLVHRRNEDERRRQDEVAAALERSRLEARMEREQREQRTRFMSMLNHEMRTPLAVLQMALPLLGQEDGTRQDVAGHARKAAQDLGGIVGRVVGLDRLEAEPPALRKVRCEVPALLERLRQDSGFPERMQILCSGSPVLDADPDALGAVLANLADNALRYSPPASAVLVAVDEAPRGGRRALRIAFENDAGAPGMPDPDELFRKYYRAPGASRETGLGLGLYLSRRLTELLGGELVYAVRDNRIRFELWLPA